MAWLFLHTKVRGAQSRCISARLLWPHTAQRRVVWLVCPVVLCGRCEYLHAMFDAESNWRESRMDEVPVDVGGDVFRYAPRPSLGTSLAAPHVTTSCAAMQCLVRVHVHRCCDNDGGAGSRRPSSGCPVLASRAPAHL